MGEPVDGAAVAGGGVARRAGQATLALTASRSAVEGQSEARRFGRAAWGWSYLKAGTDPDGPGCQAVSRAATAASAMAPAASSGSATSSVVVWVKVCPARSAGRSHSTGQPARCKVVISR